MKVLMVTPHLPPHQAANALLPHLLGEALEQRGHEARYLTWGEQAASGRVAYVRRRAAGGIWRRTRLPQLLEALETWHRGTPLLRQADVVHVHSNTWVNQVAARLAHRHARPYLLTHYGTEIWHHDGKDPIFRRMNERADHVTFYSRALLERAELLELPMRAGSVVYPPVAESFQPLAPAERQAVRRRHGLDEAPLLLNVKRLHPLADQATLLEAMARLLKRRPRARLLIAGTGESEGALKQQARELGLGESVRFLGLVPNDEVAQLQAAADLFVLSSVLEATPTVALEALACDTPVISTDNPGGKELQQFFSEDLRVVPRQNPQALAEAIAAFLERPRRAGAQTRRELERQFRLEGVVTRYLTLYEEALGR